MSEARHTAAEHSVITTYRKPIWRNFISAVKNYQLIAPNDCIAVCISGGKDSLLLATCLRALQRHSEVPFELRYLCMDPGYTMENRAQVLENARRLEIPLEMFESDIFSVVNDVPSSPCHVCAAMRRGYLYKEAQKRGCNKIALGHHYDDAVATALMSLFYGGQFKTMMPKVKSDNWQGMELIRPLFLVREEHIIAWQQEQGLQCLRCACRVTSSEDGGKRKYIRDLIERLSQDNPKLKNNIFAALSAVDLDTVLGYRAVGADRITPFTDEYSGPQRPNADNEPEVKA